MNKPIKSRILYFDLLRLILVLAALFSHLLTAQKMTEILNENTIVYIKVFTRSAMPGLLIIFGFVMDYVYGQRLESLGKKIVFTKILSQMVLCYLAFTTLALLGYFTGVNGLKTLIGSFIFLSGAQFANLFKYYVILFPIVLILIVLKYKVGWLKNIFLIFLAVAFAELFNIIFKNYDLGYFNHFFALVFGLKDEWGPSIIHSLLFVLYGQLLARYIIFKQKSQFLSMAVIFVLSFLVLFFEQKQIGFYSFLKNIGDYKIYRATNSYVYITYSIVSFSILWALCILVSKFLSTKIAHYISFYGGNTFIIFYWGNFIILLTSNITKNLHTFCLVTIVTVLMSLWFVHLIKIAQKKVAFVQKSNNLIERFSNKTIDKLNYLTLNNKLVNHLLENTK